MKTNKQLKYKGLQFIVIIDDEKKICYAKCIDFPEIVAQSTLNNNDEFDERFGIRLAMYKCYIKYQRRLRDIIIEEYVKKEFEIQYIDYDIREEGKLITKYIMKKYPDFDDKQFKYLKDLDIKLDINEEINMILLKKDDNKK